MYWSYTVYIDIFAAKNVSSFCNAKAIHIFSAKNIAVFAIFQDRNFNVTLALLSFEQLGTAYNPQM